jgi:hypothetical protein
MKEKFKSIFEGLSIAYGQYQKGDHDENGKQKGRAFIVRKNVTDELWENHINGVGRPTFDTVQPNQVPLSFDCCTVFKLYT